MLVFSRPGRLKQTQVFKSLGNACRVFWTNQNLSVGLKEENSFTHSLTVCVTLLRNVVLTVLLCVRASLADFGLLSPVTWDSVPVGRLAQLQRTCNIKRAFSAWRVWAEDLREVFKVQSLLPRLSKGICRI